jgi:hypothetical protein
MDEKRLASVMADIEKAAVIVREQLDEARTQLFALGDESEVAWTAAYKGKDPDEPVDPEAERQYVLAQRRVDRQHALINSLERKLADLTTGRQIEQRLDNLDRITKLRERSTKVPKQSPKDQGVPDVYLNAENGNFRIGMDARLKSDLINSILGIITTEKPGDSLHVFEEAHAMDILTARDWTGFLDRKRELSAEQATKKAARDAEKEERARVRAEEKKARDDAKAAEKAAKAEAGEGNSGGGGAKAPSKSDLARQQREAKAAEREAEAAAATS